MQSFSVYGNGAVGSAVAYFLKDYPCNLYNRKQENVGFVNVSGVKHSLTNHTTPDSLHIICTKAYDVMSCVEEIKKNYPNAQILVLSNGYLDDLLTNQKNVFRGVVMFGVTKKESIYEIISSAPQIKTTKQLGYLKNISPVFKAEPNCEFIGEKFFFNLVLNTLCSAYQLQNNGLVKTIPKILETTSKEAFALTQKLHPDFQASEKTMHDKLNKLIDSVFYNENSMYSDYLNKRPSERPYLSGKAVSRHGFASLKALDAVIASTETPKS